MDELHLFGLAEMDTKKDVVKLLQSKSVYQPDFIKKTKIKQSQSIRTHFLLNKLQTARKV